MTQYDGYINEIVLYVIIDPQGYIRYVDAWATGWGLKHCLLMYLDMFGGGWNTKTPWYQLRVHTATYCFSMTAAVPSSSAVQTINFPVGMLISTTRECWVK